MAVNYANGLVDFIEFSGLICTRNEGGLKEKILNDVAYKFLNKNHNLDIKAFLKLRSFCIHNKIKYIHAHSSSFFWAVLIKFTIPKIKVIWHDHYGNSDFLDNRNKFILKVASYFFYKIIVVNKKLLDWSIKELNCKDVYYLSNFPVLNKIIQKENILKGIVGKRILFLANLRPQKNHFFLLEIATLLKKFDDSWTFHLVGKDFNDEYSKTLKKAILDKKLEKNVFIYGSDNRTEKIINESTFGVLPSISEGLPVSLLEFGYLKKTVVASNVGDVKNLIINNKTGVLIESHDCQLFFESIKKLITDLEFRNNLEKKFFKLINEKYTNKVILQQYLDSVIEHQEWDK